MFAYSDRRYPSKSERQYWLDRWKKKQDLRRQSRAVPRSFAAKIKTRDGGMCAYCGVRPSRFKDLTIDHILPKSKGGQKAWNNCVSACSDCNLSKGSKQLWDWWKEPHRTPGREAYLLSILHP